MRLMKKSSAIAGPIRRERPVGTIARGSGLLRDRELLRTSAEVEDEGAVPVSVAPLGPSAVRVARVGLVGDPVAAPASGSSAVANSAGSAHSVRSPAPVRSNTGQ